MTYAKKTLSEIKLIHGNYGNFIKGQKLPNTKEKKYKEPPYQDLTSSAGSLQKNKQKAKQIADTANKNAAMSGSGATTSVGKINFGGF